jgi:aspartyl protease family protein
MKTQIHNLIIFLFFINYNANSQTVFYNQDGLKIDKLDASNYRIYILDKTNKKGVFKEFNMQNKLLIESSFLKFDFFNKKNQILNGNYTEYRNDSIYRINYKNNIPINQVNVYDNKNRIIEIIPVKNGKITYDSDVIKFYYFQESEKNEYYTMQGRFELDNYFGTVIFFYEDRTETYYFNGEDLNKVFRNPINDKCYTFTYKVSKDKNGYGILSFKDNYNCGKNNNWLMFYALKESAINFEYTDIKNDQLYLEVFQDKTPTAFRLINPTPFSIKKNDFDVRINITSQNGCVSGITLNNINYETNKYTDQYRIGLAKDLGFILLEKMVDEIYVNEKSIDVSHILRDKNELRLLKEDNVLKIILNNSHIYTDSDYSYVGESVGLYCFGTKGKYTYFDDFELKIKVDGNEDSNVIKMKKSGNTYEVPISLNDVIKTDFIIDTGASNVSITPDLASLLIKSGTINNEDWLQDKYYKFADGSIARSKTFKIKKLKIGNKYLYNVECSISNNLEAPLLLGQSVLNRFGKVTIDNEKQILFLE